MDDSKLARLPRSRPLVEGLKKTFDLDFIELVGAVSEQARELLVEYNEDQEELKANKSRIDANAQKIDKFVKFLESKNMTVHNIEDDYILNRLNYTLTERSVKVEIERTVNRAINKGKKVALNVWATVAAFVKGHDDTNFELKQQGYDPKIISDAAYAPIDLLERYGEVRKVAITL